jgi:hypothetical protein
LRIKNRISIFPSMITFVSYLTSEHSVQFLKKMFNGTSGEAMQEFRSDYEYLEKKKFAIIEAFFSSVFLFHPNSKRILIVDENVDQDKLHGPFEVRVEKRRDPYFPLAKFRAWQNFLLGSSLEKGPVLFMDWDILVQDNLNAIFSTVHDFFISYTRKEGIGPNHFNVGVLGVGEKARIKVAKFFHLLSFMIQSNNTPGLIDWWGDQAAMEAIFTPYWEDILRYQETCLIRENLFVKFLDEEIYNKPMRGYFGAQSEIFVEKSKILHFRGNAKLQLLAYWKRHRQTLEEKTKSTAF